MLCAVDKHYRYLKTRSRKFDAFLNKLRSLIVEHSALFARIYKDHVKPKFHHLFHIPENMRFTKRLLSCFVTERKHRSIKAAGLHTFRNIEHTVTIDIVNRFAEEARENNNLYEKQFLLEYRAVVLAGMNLQTSKRASLQCGTVCNKDVVFFASPGGQGRISIVSSFYRAQDSDIFAEVLMKFTA